MTPIVQTYRDLLVWQRAMDAVDTVYQMSRDWLKEEIFGLTSRIRRAAVSVPANIAEGQGRSGRQGFLHHLSIANGSLREMETHALIAQRLGYSDDVACRKLMAQTTEVARLLIGLIKSLR